MKGLRLRLQDAAPTLSAGETQLADYFLCHPQEVMTAPIARIAQQAATSQAAVVRLCKKLGFEGLKELKASLAQELMEDARETAAPYGDLLPEADARTILDRVTAGHIAALRETAKVLDANSLDAAVQVLCAAGRIDAFGAGASGLIAQDLQQKLVRIGRQCCCFADPHMQLTAAASLVRGDALVLVSYSGKTKETLAVLEAAQENGAVVIALTKRAPTPLSKRADLVLSVCSPEVTVRSGATSSRITQLAVIDMLFCALAGRQYERAKPVLEKSHRYTQRRKQ